MADWTGATTLTRRSSRNAHVCLNRHKASPAAAQRRAAHQHVESPRIGTLTLPARTEWHERAAGATVAVQPAVRASCTIAQPRSQKRQSELGHICKTMLDEWLRFPHAWCTSSPRERCSATSKRRPARGIARSGNPSAGLRTFAVAATRSGIRRWRWRRRGYTGVFHSVAAMESRRSGTASAQMTLDTAATRLRRHVAPCVCTPVRGRRGTPLPCAGDTEVDTPHRGHSYTGRESTE